MGVRWNEVLGADIISAFTSEARFTDGVRNRASGLALPLPQRCVMLLLLTYLPDRPNGPNSADHTRRGWGSAGTRC